MPNPFDEQPESQLITACAAGNREAWTCLITRYESGLEEFLRLLVFRHGIKDENVVSALVSNVWSEQLEGKRFATYDPKRGTLRKFLHGLARKHVQRWVHSRASEERHNREAMRRKPKKMADGDGSLVIMLADFIGQASPGERAYIHQELIGDWPASEAKALSNANKRQLHHRAVRRLCQLLGIRDKSSVGR
jgi:hypothetical protein